MKLIKELSNGKKVVFDKGRFDDWCVYVVENNGSKLAPYDKQYFSAFKVIASDYNENKVYNDFVKIYEKTNASISSSVTKSIGLIANTYKQEHKDVVEQWFSVIYAGMIAEENKKNAILKKRIKRLGMYQVLVLGWEPEKAAKYSYGKKWKELDETMRKFGF